MSNETILLAAEKGLPEVVKWLCSGFGVERNSSLSDQGVHREDSIFHLTRAVDAAAMNGHLDVVKYLHEMTKSRMRVRIQPHKRKGN